MAAKPAGGAGAGVIPDHERAELVRRLIEERDAAVAGAESNRRRFESLQSMMLAMSGVRSTEAALDVTLGAGLEVVGATAGLAAIVDEPAGLVRVLAAVGTPDGGGPVASSFALERDNPVGRCVLDGGSGFVTDPADLPPGVPVVVAPGAPSPGPVAVLPLPSGPTTLGALLLSFDGPQAFDVDQVLSLTTLANMAAAALVRVRLIEEEDASRSEVARMAERNAFLAEATAVVSAPLDERTVLERLARLCVPRLGDWCSISRPRGDVLERIIVHHHDPDREVLARSLQGRQVPIDDETPVAITFRTGTPHALPDLRRAMAADPQLTEDHVEVFRRLGDAAGITVPIGHASRPVGVLAFAVGEGRTLTDDDVDLAVEIALRAGIAVGHAADFARERDAAALLQRAILPAALPTVRGFDLAATYRPADVARTVGGDWFDVCHLDPHRLALTVGDVAGHGLAAAAAMGHLRHALRAYLFEGHPPGEALRRTNLLLLAERPRRHATVVVAVLDLRTGDVVAANAGHLPSLVAGSGAARLVDRERGPMLGVFHDARYPEHRLHLAVGDTLVLFTDGLVERRRRSLDEALAGLRLDVDRSPPGADLQAWCDDLVRDQARTSDHDDDRCVLALRAVPVAAGDPAAGSSPADGPDAEPPAVEAPLLLDLDLEPAPGAARVVRRSLGAVLGSHPGLAELQLCATEVVTNAVVHARTPFTVTARQGDGCIRVAVRDASRLLPQLQPHQPAASRGRGLQLLEALTVAWGVQQDADGKVVWFDIAG